LKSDILTNGKLRATYGQVSIMPSIYRGSSYIGGAGGAESWGPAYDAAAYNGGLSNSFLEAILIKARNKNRIRGRR
jgi:hypothetical protein